MKAALPVLIVASISFHLNAQQSMALKEKAYSAANKIEAKCISWRREIHQHPELGNNEYKTAKLIADHLKKLGLDVKENFANDEQVFETL